MILAGVLTSADWLKILEPRLVEPLFDSETVERLCRLAVALPGECQGTFEVRLRPGVAPADLSVRLRKPHEARTMASLLPSSPAGKFLTLWSEATGPIAPVRSVWLEFDLDRMLAEGFPAPMVCVKLQRGADADWLTDTLLPALQDHPLPAGQRTRIRSCLGALPPSATLLYVFDLQARGSDAVRLEIFGLESAGILDLLQILMPKVTSSVKKVVPLFAGVERLHLSFDVTDEVLPRIGIEGSFPRQPSLDPRWKIFFERLVREGLCTPGKRDAALAWPGYETFWTTAERWPVAALGPKGVCLRTLSHLKVVCAPDREPEAKAYLVFGPPDRPSENTASSAASRSAFST